MPEVVVITGASAGVGRATARLYARRGAGIALIARGRAGLEAAAKEVADLGGRALVQQADTADAQQIEAAAEAVERALGPIDVWINCAFTSVFAPFAEIGPTEYERVTKVTYLGFVNGTRAALARMLPRDRGTIVQVGSALGERAIPLQSAYCGAKHAVNGFTSSVRTELMHQGSAVRITVVQMPAVNTPQFSWVLSRLPRHPQPVPPIYQPEVAAKAVVHAADHPRRREYWVGGSTVGTLVANAVAPGILDRYLAKTGYQSQQTDADKAAHQPENLWAPADRTRDFGAHGEFDDQATPRSLQLWGSRHHGLLAAGGGALAATALAVWRRARS
jgi:short-subunit dehydrogenase